MRGYLALFLFVAVLGIGCQSDRVSKVDDPVVGPPPPRKSLVEQQRRTEREDSAFINDVLDPQVDGSEPGDIVNVSANEGGSEAVTIAEVEEGSSLATPEIVATVNGTPIFASELLLPFAASLEKIKEQAPPYVYQMQRKMVLKRELQRRIESLSILEAMRSELKPEQVQQIDVFLDSQFEKEVAKLKKTFNVTTRIEVDEQLQKNGSNLKRLRQQFGEVRMAADFVASRATNGKKDFSRQELMDYYEANKNDYEIIGKVRWQQLEVLTRKHGDETGAARWINKAIKEVREGADFGEVCAKYSDGLRASEQGIWDWTTIGSLLDKDKEALLFKLPIGNYSSVIKSDRGYMLLKVLERQSPGFVPFSDVQTKIEAKLKNEAYMAETARVRQEMLDNAVVERFVDLSNVPDFPDQ
ncbi:MAG: hypothetical protein CMJ78_08025 [Planctomycetaceae bacterium]|nr:hypothetical protein [Planctomycetaceae bacterium]